MVTDCGYGYTIITSNIFAKFALAGDLYTHRFQGINIRLRWDLMVEKSEIFILYFEPS